MDNTKNINDEYLKTFEKWLKEKGLTKKTIHNHITNVDFYINDCIHEYLEEDIVQGCYKVSYFLGYWFIKKAMWSSCSAIKNSAASFKKFYKCMLENGVVTQSDYDKLCETIRDEMPDWLEEVKRFNSFYEDDYF